MPQNKDLQALVEASVGHSFSGKSDHLYRSDWLCWFRGTTLKSAMGMMWVDSKTVFITEFCGHKRGLALLMNYMDNLPGTVQGVVKYDNIEMQELSIARGYTPKGILFEKVK